MVSVSLLAHMAQPIAQDNSRHRALLQVVGALPLEAHGVVEVPADGWVATEADKQDGKFPRNGE